MFTQSEIEVLTKSSGDFVFFVNNIFSKSVKTFVGGEHVDSVARFLSQNNRTIRVSARDHFKSFSFYAYFMWKLMFEGAANNLEAHYFSYNGALAGYHINKIKQAIEMNPYFRDIIDKKPTAETVLRYTWDNKHFTSITPSGLLQFKRGIHCLGPNEAIVVRNPKTRKIKKCAIQNIYRTDKTENAKYTEILTEDGFKKITNYLVRQNTDPLLKIELKNGANMKITPDHPCLIKRNDREMIIPASDLLLTDRIPYYPQLFTNDKKNLGSYDLGRFIGIYCGDGSRLSTKGLQFVNNPKKGTSIFLKEFIETHLGANTRTISYGTYEKFYISGKAALELAQRYVKGQSSRTKHLSSDFLNMSIEFRKGFIDGYLESDGSGNRIASTSDQLMNDTCAVLNSLGYHYTLLRNKLDVMWGYNDSMTYDEWLKKIPKEDITEDSLDNDATYGILISPRDKKGRSTFRKKRIISDENNIYWLPITKITKSNRIPDFVYDIEVGSDSHLFSLANGIITHNCDMVFVDDPFQDPENELNPTIIYKINEIFKSNILDMPKQPDGVLLVTGTPQTAQDFFFDKSITSRFATQIQPAIQKDIKTGEEKALWPEWMTLEELYAKREERTPRIFSREYLCTPVYSTKGFFSKDKLKSHIIDPDLVMKQITKDHLTENDVIAGFDIGKKSHPSHLSVFEYKNGKLVMIHQKFMDNWPYSNGKEYIPTQPTQLEYLKVAIRHFKIKELKYDNTRGEFETLDEQNLLPKQMTPIVFTNKFKNAGATAFDRLVEKKQISIPNDERLIDQICALTDELQAIQTSLGHADAFWSIVLAIMCAKDLIGFYDDDLNNKQRRKINTGERSIFLEGSPIPKGF